MKIIEIRIDKLSQLPLQSIINNIVFLVLWLYGPDMISKWLNNSPKEEFSLTRILL